MRETSTFEIPPHFDMAAVVLFGAAATAPTPTEAQACVRLCECGRLACFFEVRPAEYPTWGLSATGHKPIATVRRLIEEYANICRELRLGKIPAEFELVEFGRHDEADIVMWQRPTD